MASNVAPLPSVPRRPRAAALARLTSSADASPPAGASGLSSSSAVRARRGSGTSTKSKSGCSKRLTHAAATGFAGPAAAAGACEIESAEAVDAGGAFEGSAALDAALEALGAAAAAVGDAREAPKRTVSVERISTMTVTRDPPRTGNDPLKCRPPRPPNPRAPGESIARNALAERTACPCGQTSRGGGRSP